MRVIDTSLNGQGQSFCNLEEETEIAVEVVGIGVAFVFHDGTIYISSCSHVVRVVVVDAGFRILQLHCRREVEDVAPVRCSVLVVGH